MSDPKQAAVDKFTNLLDGCVKSNVSVSEIIDYYIAQLNKAHVVVRNNCNITSQFKEAEIAEMEEDYEY